MEYIERISLDVGNFADFGDQIIQLYYDIARVSGWNEESLRRRCLKYLEHNAERWHYEARDRPWCENIRQPTPNEIIAVIGGMYALERASLSSPFDKTEVSKFIVAAATEDPEAGKFAATVEAGASNTTPLPVRYDSTTLIGWDPHTETPPEQHSELCLDCGQRSARDRKMCQYCGKQLNIVSKYRIYSNSLINTFYADNTLMPFGGHDYCSILKHLPTLRPYQMYGATNISWDHFWQECYMVTHLIFTLSNWGELSLDKKLFIHEYEFIHHCAPIHLENNDVHLVSECLECLKILGDTDNDTHVQKYMQWLLSVQDVNDGSWDPPDESAYNKFHATMCACQTLMVHKRRAHGPGIVNCLDLLYEWHTNDMVSVSMQSHLLHMNMTTGRSMDPRERTFVQLTDHLMLNTLSAEEAAYQNLALITVNSTNPPQNQEINQTEDEQPDQPNKRVKTTKKSSDSRTTGGLPKTVAAAAPAVPTTATGPTTKKKKKKKEASSSSSSNKKLKESLTSIEECLQQLEQLESAAMATATSVISTETTKSFKIIYKMLLDFVSADNGSSSNNNSNNKSQMKKHMPRIKKHLVAVRACASDQENSKLLDYTNHVFTKLLGTTMEGKLSRAVNEVKQLVLNTSLLSKADVNEQINFWHIQLMPSASYTQKDLIHSGAIELVKTMKKSTNGNTKKYGDVVWTKWKKHFKKNSGGDGTSSSSSSSNNSSSSNSVSSSNSTNNGKTKKKNNANKKERKKRPRTSKSPTTTALAAEDERPVKKNTTSKLKGKEYVGQKVYYKGQSGKVSRYFPGDDEDESVWKIVFDKDSSLSSPLELEEKELRKAFLTFQKMHE